MKNMYYYSIFMLSIIISYENGMQGSQESEIDTSTVSIMDSMHESVPSEPAASMQENSLPGSDISQEYVQPNKQPFIFEEEEAVPSIYNYEEELSTPEEYGLGEFELTEEEQ